MLTLRIEKIMPRNTNFNDSLNDTLGWIFEVHEKNVTPLTD